MQLTQELLAVAKAMYQVVAQQVEQVMAALVLLVLQVPTSLAQAVVVALIPMR
jgi:hypothetical protein